MSLVVIVYHALNHGGNKLRHTRDQIDAMQYRFLHCIWCNAKLDTNSDIVVVSTHGTYCTRCWRSFVLEMTNNINEVDHVAIP